MGAKEFIIWVALGFIGDLIILSRQPGGLKGSEAQRLFMLIAFAVCLGPLTIIIALFDKSEE